MTDTVPEDVRALARGTAAGVNIRMTTSQETALADSIARAILADRKARALSAPEGFALVPRTITERMSRVLEIASQPRTIVTSQDVWDALLEAAEPAGAPRIYFAGNG